MNHLILLLQSELLFDICADSFHFRRSAKVVQSVANCRVIGEFPNTYAFTKAIAEDIVKNYGRDIPTCVFRPSIVVPTAEEPISGWIDNIYGPTGI